MKKTIYLFAAALALAGLSACDKNGNDPDTAEGSDARFMAIADRFVNHTVIPTYTSLSDYTEQLVEDLAALKSETTQANLDKACETFLTARAWWEKSEAFLWGAATDFGIDPHIDTWPLDLVGLKEALTNSAQIDGLAGEDGDVYAGEKLGPSLLGFHGIEYVLFYEGKNREVSWFAEGNTDNGVNCADYLTYAVAVAGDLRNKCWQMEIAWAGESHNPERYAKVNDELELPLTMTGGAYYGENLLNAGNAGSSCPNATVAMQWLIEGCNTIADEVASQKIGMVYSGEDKNYVESPYSYKSIVDFEDNMISIENVWNGGIEGDYDSVNSLSAYFKETNPDLEKRISDAIDNSIAKIRAIPEPFIENFQNENCAAAIEAIQELDTALSTAINELTR